MTVSATNAHSTGTGNGSAVAFPFTFTAMATDEVAVYVDDVLQTSSTYTVALSSSGGTVTFDAAPANGAAILIVSEPDFTQDIDFANNGAFLADTHDEANDRGAVRSIFAKARLAILFASTMFSSSGRAGKFLAWNASGNPIMSDGTGADAGLRTDLASSASGKGVGLVATATGTAETVVGSLPIPVQDFGAMGGVGNDDRAAIQAAIDYAFSIGGGTLVTAKGTKHYYSGRILLRPGVRIDFRNNQMTDQVPFGVEGSQLIATDVAGGIDLVAGSQIRASLRTSQSATYTGPMLEVSDAKSTELNFGRNEREAVFDVDMRGNRQPDSTGLKIISSTSSGVAWMRNCRAVIGEMDNGAIFETSGSGYINENWMDLTIYGARYFLRGINNGNEIAANRIRLTAQPDNTARAKRAVLWDGKHNFIEIKVWDWKSTHVDATEGGAQVEFTSVSSGNLLLGTLARGAANGDGTRMPVIDHSARGSGKNTIKVFNGQTQEAVNAERIMPASYFERVYAGDQDDSLAFANRRYTVTVAGSTPPDATSQNRLFDLSAANLAVASCTDFTVTVDFGVTPDGTMGMGVSMISGLLPDKIKVEGSPDNATWSLIMSAGYNSDPVPLHLLRDNGVGAFRYYRMTVVCNTPKTVNINRWWAVDAGFTRLPGAFLPVYNPLVYGPLRINGTDGVQVQGLKVIGARQAAIANAVGGDEVTKINAILAALRQHGLIAT